MIEDTRPNLRWLLQTLALLVFALLLLPGAPALHPRRIAHVLLSGITPAHQVCVTSSTSAGVNGASLSPIVWWRDVMPAGWLPDVGMKPPPTGPSIPSTSDAGPQVIRSL